MLRAEWLLEQAQAAVQSRGQWYMQGGGDADLPL